MHEQTGFSFDAPLVRDPVSQHPNAAPLSLAVQHLLAMPRTEFVECLRQLAPTMPDEISYDDLLAVAGLPAHSITGYHRSAAMEALLPPLGEYQAYQPGSGGVRFRRLYRCPGFEGAECRAFTGGGVLCPNCRRVEEEDLLNQE